MTDSSAPVSSIEKEFGVPIPGAILPEDQWAKTALKKVPEGLLNWAELFGRVAPVLIDVGCGNGRSMLTSAVARPEMNHLGIDILPVVIRYATRRGNQRGLANTRWAVIGGREFLLNHVEAGSVAEIFGCVAGAVFCICTVRPSILRFVLLGMEKWHATRRGVCVSSWQAVRSLSA